MREPSDITVNGRSLTDILSDHIAWLYEPAGHETHKRANLSGADLSSADLSSANLSSADLWDADLWDAYLWGANLWGANLSGANLWGANLSGANLSGANLWGANLWGADLSGANLWGANLWGANLRGAGLRGANLSSANLSSAKGIIFVGPVGSRGGMTYFVHHDTCIMVQCGCFWGTLDEFTAQVERVHGNNQHGRAYRAAVEMIKTVMPFAEGGHDGN